MSSNEVVMAVENLSKRYRIGRRVSRADSIGSLIRQIALQPLRRFQDLRDLVRFDEVEDPATVLWALRGVSFEVRRGEVLGIMGANGAGKSTLLKILSRVISPTEGQFRYKGTLSSLLEVGTGFSGDLTGRENIYLNGAILGMKREQIDRVFDEIVEFSGVERFIDTPVKRYSSGMTVRLAFSVAAHLDPEILILDEVLSVGDAQFSQRSMRKMESVAQDGRTVIFVSHSTTAVQKLCHRALFISAGQITAEGPVEKITGLYLGDTSHTRAAVVWDDAVAPRAEGLIKLNSVKLVDQSGEAIENADIRQMLGVEISFEVLRGGKMVLAEFQLATEQKQILFTSAERDEEWSYREREPGLYTVTGWIPGNTLAEGRFSISVAFFSPSPHDVYLTESEVLWFSVTDPLEGDSVRCDYGTAVSGLVRPRLDWS
jgi:lipopolysaccharide transport system ATP-binding protein